MSLYNGPPRGGARGGKDQFNWEGVKSDKDRECYLGHSVKALTGRWQKGKDVYWYTREKGTEGGLDKELLQVKEREAQLMAEALGLKPKEKSENKRKLDALEMQQLLQRSGGGEPMGGEGGDDGAEARVKGVGYAPGAMGGVAGREVLEGYNELPPPPPRETSGACLERRERPEHGGDDDGHARNDVEHARKRSKHDAKAPRDKHKDKHKEKSHKKHKKDKSEKKHRKERRRHKTP